MCVLSVSHGDGFQLRHTVQCVDGIRLSASYWNAYDINRFDDCIGVMYSKRLSAKRILQSSFILCVEMCES